MKIEWKVLFNKHYLLYIDKKDTKIAIRFESASWSVLDDGKVIDRKSFKNESQKRAIQLYNQRKFINEIRDDINYPAKF
jgi:hypothetical protein